VNRGAFNKGINQVQPALPYHGARHVAEEHRAAAALSGRKLKSKEN